MKSRFILAGNTKRRALGKVLYVGQNVVWAFRGNGVGGIFVGLNAAASLLLLFTGITWIKKKKIYEWDLSEVCFFFLSSENMTSNCYTFSCCWLSVPKKGELSVTKSMSTECILII